MMDIIRHPLIGARTFDDLCFTATVIAQKRSSAKDGLLTTFLVGSRFNDANRNKKGRQKAIKGHQNLLTTLFSRYPSQKLPVKQKTNDDLFYPMSIAKTQKVVKTPPGLLKDPLPLHRTKKGGER